MTNQEIAQILDRAAQSAKAVPQMAAANNITLKDAYNIQKQSIALREKRGEKITGFKLGFTSKAKMQQMGVHDLIWGILTDEMQILPNEIVAKNRWIHPRVEPEIAFRVSKDFDKELTLSELPQYIDGMASALEIIDSRYENFKFSLEDVVADNCSSTGYVIGEWKNLEMEISNLKISILENDQVVENATSAAILDNPLLSVVELSRLALEAGAEVRKGHVILAGAATAAIFLKQNSHYKTTVEKLDKVEFWVE